MANSTTGKHPLFSHFDALSQKLLLDLDGVSRQLRHAGATGRNNEKIVERFLEQYLPARFAITNGKVISATGEESNEIDLIIYDQFVTRGLAIGEDFRLVPIEGTCAVISIRTSIDAKGLRDTVENVASVRNLTPVAAAHFKSDGSVLRPRPEKLLRPRAFIFAFESGWTTPAGADQAFRSAVQDIPDPLRPNGLCILNQCFIQRKPFAVNTTVRSDRPLLRFFTFLVGALSNFPVWQVDMRMYFESASDSE